MDSTTWALHAGYGRIRVATTTNEEWDYARGQSVVVSGKKQSTRAANRQRLDYISATDGHRLDEIREFLEQELGLSLPEVRYSVQGRRRAIAIYLKHLEDLICETRPFSIFHATSPSHDHSAVLNDLGITNRLVSFVDFKDRPTEHFREYVMTRKLPGEYQPRVSKMDWNFESYLNMRKFALYYHIHREREDD